MMEATAFTARAHKLAYALSTRLGKEVTVRRMPLTKDGRLLGFGFVCGDYYTVFGQSFLEGNLNPFAMRLLADIKGDRNGQHRKSHAGRQG